MDTAPGQCVEYKRTGKGYVRRVIEPMFVTVKINAEAVTNFAKCDGLTGTE